MGNGEGEVEVEGKGEGHSSSNERERHHLVREATNCFIWKGMDMNGVT